MESLNFVFEQIERNLGIGDWVGASMPLFPSSLLFGFSTAFTLIGARLIQGQLRERNAIVIQTAGFSRTAWRLSKDFIIFSLATLEAIWILALFTSLKWILGAPLD